MERVALVSGADRGLGLAICERLLQSGWTVLAGQYLEWPDLAKLQAKFPDKLHVLPLDVSSDSSVSTCLEACNGRVKHIDLLVANAAMNRSHQIQSIRDDLDFEVILQEINTNAVGNLRLVKAFLPLVCQGEMKRLCFVSSEAGSIGASKRTGWFGYCMSKAALNMAVKNLHNDLGREGIGFRLYHPGYLRTYMSGTKNLDAHMEPEEGAKYAVEYFLDDSVPNDLVLRDWQRTEYPW